MSNPAGRELDALIAERLFSARPTEPHPEADGIHQMSCANNVWLWHGHRGEWLPYPWRHYSTDIAAAWKVVERMRERGFWMRLQSPFEIDGKQWNAGFTEHSFTGWNGRPDYTGQADTAPHAICLAALKAIGGTDEHE